MKKLKIKLDELLFAFESCREDDRYYLDINTGEVVNCSEWMDSEEFKKTKKMINSNKKRYISIPTTSSREEYRKMEKFIDTVEDENLRGKLIIAIDGRGAFRRFKDVLLNYPDYRQKWFDFKNELLLGEAKRWLEDEGIEMESEND